MKKFLSIFIAVAMVMSFAAVFANAPTAMAAVSGMELTDYTAATMPDLEWFDPVPTYTTDGTVQTDAYWVYDMGDTIHGELDDVAVAAWKVELIDTDSNVIDTVNMAAGGSTFSIGTGNVSKDGQYTVRATVDGSSYDETVFIKYNIALSNDDVAVSDCTVFPTSKTISGWITRGSGQTVEVPVDVYVSYPGTDVLNHIPNYSGYSYRRFPCLCSRWLRSRKH